MKKKHYFMSLLCLPLCMAACSAFGDKPADRESQQVTVASEPAPMASSEPDKPVESVMPSEAAQVHAEKPVSTPAAASRDGISIQYIGNSCFYIVFPDGTRLLSDPFGSRYESSFAPIPVMEADVVTVSHRHDDHTGGIYELKGTPQIIYPERLGEEITVGEVIIKGYPSKHVTKGSNMGDNTVFIYENAGHKIVHMGETDRIEDENALNALKDADVLLMYAGEYGGVKNDEIISFAQDLNIKVLVPQHFSMDPKALWYDQPSIDMILEEVPESMPVSEIDRLIINNDMEPGFVVLMPMSR